MTDMDPIQSAFSKSVCSQISLVQEGLNRYRVFTPFYFDDGDHLAIVLKKDESGQMVFSDEGHTLMHISYDMEYSDLMLRNRFKIIRDALSVYMSQLPRPKGRGLGLYSVVPVWVVDCTPALPSYT